MNRSAPAVVIVLAKAPIPGRVKTRLCPPATPEQAADVAAAALLDTLDCLGSLVGSWPGTRVVAALTGPLPAASRGVELRAALHAATVIRQRGSSLGARIAAAHADTAARLPGRPTLLLGMDTPQVDAALLGSCLTELSTMDDDVALLGPSTDGGWWALGLRKPDRAALLAGVPTSRPDTGARTASALQAGGLRVRLLPELTDVDTAADARAVSRRIPRSRFAAAVAGL